jgi:hypothetical protein
MLSAPRFFLHFYMMIVMRICGLKRWGRSVATRMARTITLAPLK